MVPALGAVMQSAWPEGAVVFAVFNIHQRVQKVSNGHIRLGDNPVMPCAEPLRVFNDHDEAEAWRLKRIEEMESGQMTNPIPEKATP
jgi:hypothetical protein